MHLPCEMRETLWFQLSFSCFPTMSGYSHWQGPASIFTASLSLEGLYKVPPKIGTYRSGQWIWYRSWLQVCTNWKCIFLTAPSYSCTPIIQIQWNRKPYATNWYNESKIQENASTSTNNNQHPSKHLLALPRRVEKRCSPSSNGEAKPRMLACSQESIPNHTKSYDAHSLNSLCT